MKTLKKVIQKAIDEGLGQWIVAANDAAKQRLSGSDSDAAGSYPVPVRTGNLRRTQDYVLPRRSKRGITAKSGEAWLVNTAAYAAAIHDGTARYKARPFASDAINDTKEKGMQMIVTTVSGALRTTPLPFS